MQETPRTVSVSDMKTNPPAPSKGEIEEPSQSPPLKKGVGIFLNGAVHESTPRSEMRDVSDMKLHEYYG